MNTVVQLPVCSFRKAAAGPPKIEPTPLSDIEEAVIGGGEFRPKGVGKGRTDEDQIPVLFAAKWLELGVSRNLDFGCRARVGLAPPSIPATRPTNAPL
jgi:hypothetical protein